MYWQGVGMFSDKENFEIYILILLVSFHSGGYVDDVVSNQTNYQFTKIILWMAHECVGLLEELFLMCASV